MCALLHILYVLRVLSNIVCTTAYNIYSSQAEGEESVHEARRLVEGYKEA